MKKFGKDDPSNERLTMVLELIRAGRGIKPVGHPEHNSPENLEQIKIRDSLHEKYKEAERLSQERNRKRKEILEKHKYSLVDQACPIESDEQFESIRDETYKLQRKLILLRREGKDSVALQEQLTANRLAIAKHTKVFRDVFVLPNKINDVVTPDMISNNIVEATEEETIQFKEPKDYKALAKKEAGDAMFTQVFCGGILLFGLFMILHAIRFPANKSFYGFEALIAYLFPLALPVLAFFTAYLFAWLGEKIKTPDREILLRNLGEYNDTIEPYRGVTIQKLDENWWELELSDALMDRRKEKKVRVGINTFTIEGVYELIDWAYARGWW